MSRRSLNTPRRSRSLAITLSIGMILVTASDVPGQEPPAAPAASSLLPGAREGVVDSAGVPIHYVSLGREHAPLMVLIHGFPDFWYSWRAQMPALAKSHHVVAIDQRGYNLSGQPEGVENYTIAKLVGDLTAVVKHFGPGKAVIVGHDWGGMVAWTFAMTHPELTDRLIVLNLPHPRGLLRELTTNPKQQRNSQYARDFQKPDAARKLTAEALAGWVKDPEARKVYRDALARSSMEGMLNYYKANYPRITPGESSARDQGRRRRPHIPAGHLLRPADPRPEGPGPLARCPQRHLELDRCGPDPGDHPRRRPLRPARRRRPGHPDAWRAG